MALVTVSASYQDGEEFLRVDFDEATEQYVLFHQDVEIARREDTNFDYSEFRPSIPSDVSIEVLAQQLTAMQSAVDDLIMTSLLG